MFNKLFIKSLKYKTLSKKISKRAENTYYTTYHFNVFEFRPIITIGRSTMFVNTHRIKFQIQISCFIGLYLYTRIDAYLCTRIIIRKVVICSADMISKLYT